MADDTDLRETLDHHPFLRGLEPTLIDRLADLAHEGQFAAGETLLSEGRLAERFFLVLDGTITLGVAQGSDKLRVIEVVREGDALGWSWLIPPYHWTFEARTRTPVRALVIDAVTLRERMRHDHQLAHALMDRILPVMAARLRAARLEVLACETNHAPS
ncbi:cyclic nucleotide-binding domain-containing protein [Pararhodospirillum photometricum]|nr:cyclic nucleotide-binding domain-containing protein [Pararhodospirillum photometricum]